MSGIDYSVLFSSGSASGDVSTGLLAALRGNSGSGSGNAVSTGSPITDLKLAEQNQAKSIARQAKDPAVVRDLAAFRKAVARAPDLKTALANPNVLKVLLTANGLAAQAQYPALAAKVLASDPSDPKSLVNRLSDSRWKAVVQTYDLAKTGLAGLAAPAVQSKLADAYERVAWLNTLDQATPGLAQAIQFKQQASKITSVDQILGDPTNWEVVLTALGIPQQIAYQDTRAQEREVGRRIDVTKLTDPNFVNSLTDQYLLIKQRGASGSSSSGGLYA